MRDLKEIQLAMQPPMVEGDHDFGSVSDKIGDITLKRKTPFHWLIGFGIAFIVAQLLGSAHRQRVLTGKPERRPLDRPLRILLDRHQEPLVRLG